jgi:potassium-dependent mechanosensitive channel
LATTSTQSRRLLQVGMLAITLMGMWLIWVDVFPALTILDRWQLGTTFVPSPEGTEVVDGQQGFTKPITISHLIIAVLVGIFTLFAAHNLPGLLEMSLLSRLPLDAAIRYAITSLASYVIVILGIIVGFNTIGVGWSQVQWLAAALTVGLGFGLQEVFGNFVSGVIILFERPVRVGDIVTIGDVSGVVSRIRIRATTITNWDRKEFIVPNKEFITGRLMNWTLSDSVTRVTINVGIAYGSDTRQATEILRQVAQDNPFVMDDPPPIITFEEFGDSSLNFAVRLFLPNLQNRLACVHQYHTDVDEAFREAGIEIAFPQRDIHIRSGAHLLPPPSSDGKAALAGQAADKLDSNGHK